MPSGAQPSALFKMRSFNVVSFPHGWESRAAPLRGHAWMPAFVGMTLTFLRHSPI
jgi:hypothetical protein